MSKILFPPTLETLAKGIANYRKARGYEQRGIFPYRRNVQIF